MNDAVKNIEVTLNETEQEIAILIAKKRTKANRDMGTKSGLLRFEGSKRAELNGFCGELIVAKALNLYPDLSTHVRSGGADVILLGNKIDIKTTEREHGKLMVTKEDNMNVVDAYILVTGKFPTYTIRGWTPYGNLIVEERVDYHLKKPAYVMIQDELIGFSLFYIHEELIKDKR